MTDIAVQPQDTRVDLRRKDQREKWINDSIDASLASVLPRHIKKDVFARVIGAEFVRNPKLADCSTKSILLCLLTSSQYGLVPSGPLGHAYLIPRSNECTLLIGYKGMCELARRTGEIARMDARVVYEGEHFQITGGSDPKIDHNPSLTVDRSDSKIVASYAVVVTKDGGVYFDFVTKAEIDARRTRSSSGRSGPWQTDYAAMARKSALRKLLMGGLVPLSAELAEAINDDDDTIDTTTTAPRRSVASILEGSRDELVDYSTPDREAAESDAAMASK